MGMRVAEHRHKHAQTVAPALRPYVLDAGVWPGSNRARCEGCNLGLPDRSPGLEPGTPRFSVVVAFRSIADDLQGVKSRDVV
jgi:hypothetical protein